MIGTFWWSLPGPNRFLDRVISELSGGKSVLIPVGLNGPETISDEIARRYQRGLVDIVDYLPVTIEDLLDHLYDRFFCATAPDFKRTVRHLTICPEFAGRTLLVTIHDRTREDIWSEFLHEFTNAVGCLDPWRRPTFCVIAQDTEGLRHVEGSAHLTALPWDGYVESTDMLLIARYRLAGMPAFYRDLCASIIAAVALWDPETCYQLLTLETLETESIFAVLQQIGAERGWNALDLTKACWTSGVKREFDGQPRFHSAALAVNKFNAQVQYRIWSAQIAVAFPALENLRRFSIRRYRHKLKVPHVDGTGRVIKSLLDLELAHVCHQLRKDPRGAPNLDRLEAAVGIRNALAHFECVSPLEICEVVPRIAEDDLFNESFLP